MPKRSSKRKDVNEIAASIVSRATEPVKVDKNPYAVAFGRLGGLKGVELGLRSYHLNVEGK